MEIDCKSICVDELCSVLPNDWAEELMEQWDEIKENTIVLGVFYNFNLIGTPRDYNMIAESYPN